MKTSTTKSKRRVRRQRFPDAGGGILAVLAEENDKPSNPNAKHDDDESPVPIKTKAAKKKKTPTAIVFSPERIIQRKIEIDEDDHDAVSELTSELGTTMRSAASSASKHFTSPSSVASQQVEDDDPETNNSGQWSEEEELYDDEEGEISDASENHDDTDAEDDSADGQDRKVAAWNKKKKEKIVDADEDVDNYDEMEYDNDDEYDPDGDETSFEDDGDDDEEEEELELDDDDLRITKKRSATPKNLSPSKQTILIPKPVKTAVVTGGKTANERKIRDETSHNSEDERYFADTGDETEDEEDTEAVTDMANNSKDSGTEHRRVVNWAEKEDTRAVAPKSIVAVLNQSQEESDEESVVIAEVIDDESFASDEIIVEAELGPDEYAEEKSISSLKSIVVVSGQDQAKIEKTKSVDTAKEAASVAPPSPAELSKTATSNTLAGLEKPSTGPRSSENGNVSSAPVLYSTPKNDSFWIGNVMLTTDDASVSDHSTAGECSGAEFSDEASLDGPCTDPSRGMDEGALVKRRSSSTSQERDASMKIIEPHCDVLEPDVHSESHRGADNSIPATLSEEEPPSEGQIRDLHTHVQHDLNSTAVGTLPISHGSAGNRAKPSRDNGMTQEKPVECAVQSAKIMSQVILAKDEHAKESTLETGLSLKNTIELKDIAASSANQSHEKYSQRTRSEGSIKQGQWTLGSRIGVGSFGVVHVGMNHRTGSLMAVKSIPMQPAIMKDIRREIELLKTLDHVNIVRYYGAEINGSDLHIFQEWVAGGSVSDLLSKFGPFPFPVIQSYAEQTLQGLAYLHANNILHRDIKGSNLLVSDAGVVKLADFGASRKMAELHSDMMMSMTIRGTPYFMAPEVFEEKYSSKADIWAVGCVLYQMATAVAPWKDLGFNNPFSLCRHLQTTHGSPPLSRTIPATDVRQLNNFLALLGQCFSRTPFDRPCVVALLRDPFILEKGYSSDDDHSVGPGLFSPEVIRTREGCLTSPLSAAKVVAKPVFSPVRNPPSQTPPRPRRNSIGPSRSPFLSPPLPKRCAQKESTIAAPYSPAKDTSEWPRWAIKKYNERAERDATQMLDSLALSSDSSVRQSDSLIDTSSIKGLEFLSE